MKSYYILLKETREDRDIRQSTIAKLLNTTQSNISKLERGERKMTIEDLTKLCIYYNITADYFLGLSEKRPLK